MREPRNWAGIRRQHSMTRSLALREDAGVRGMVSQRQFAKQTLVYFPDASRVVHGSDDHPSQRYDVPQGTVVIALRHEPETIELVENTTMVTLELQDDLLCDMAQTVLGRVDTALVASSGIVDTRLTALFETLRTEHLAGYPTGQVFAEAIERSIVAFLLAHHATEVGLPAVAKGGLAPFQARRVSEYIEDRLSDTITIRDLAATCQLSISHFARNFAVTFQETPHRYLMRRRLLRAKDLLRGADTSLLDVAQLTGFQTQQHFSRVFAHATGTTPGTFRRANG